MIIRRYSELIRLPTFKERYEYLRLGSVVGESTFGFDRYLNQTFYHSKRWRNQTRPSILLRDTFDDLVCDMGMKGYPIGERVYIHHLNPITVEQVENDDSVLYDPEFLICVSYDTHQAIHFGDENLLPKPLLKRTPGDTCPWKKMKG